MTGLKQVIVVDSSCTAESRIRKHDVLINGDIISVEFKYGEKKVLDFEVGMKFNKDGFKVLDPDTEQPILAPAVTDETIRVRIGDDEVIAKYEELTETSLKMRAAVLPNGEDLIRDDKTDREDLILFLLGARNTAAKAVEAETAASITLGESVIIGKGTKIPDPSVPKFLGPDDISE